MCVSLDFSLKIIPYSKILRAKWELIITLPSCSCPKVMENPASYRSLLERSLSTPLLGLNNSVCFVRFIFYSWSLPVVIANATRDIKRRENSSLLAVIMMGKIFWLSQTNIYFSWSYGNPICNVNRSQCFCNFFCATTPLRPITYCLQFWPRNQYWKLCIKPCVYLCEKI